MASELQLQETVQAGVQSLDRFEDQDVPINDWSVLDGSNSQAPYLIIQNSEDFESRPESTVPQERFIIRAWLVVYMGVRDLTEVYNEFRDTRQEIVNAFTAPNGVSTGGLDGVILRRVFALSDIGYIYPQGTNPEFDPDATPEYLTQMIGFEYENF